VVSATDPYACILGLSKPEQLIFLSSSSDKRRSLDRYRSHPASSVVLAACLAYSTDLKIEAVLSSAMSVNFCQTAWRHIPEKFFCTV
jgi:hypothetical protein